MTLLQHEALLDVLHADDLEARVVVTPLLDQRQIGPASIDLRLGTEFIQRRRIREDVLDPLGSAREQQVDEERIVVAIGEDLVVHPGQFILGSTLEFIRVPLHLAGQVLGRSSWARLGLIVATAVVVQPGFAGALTLELVNMGEVPMKLRPGLRIAQLMIWSLQGETAHPYPSTGKYSAPLGPRASRLGWETDERDRLLRLGEHLAGPPPSQQPGPPAR